MVHCDMWRHHISPPIVLRGYGDFVDAPAWEHTDEEQSPIHVSEAGIVQYKDEAEGIDDCSEFDCEYEFSLQSMKSDRNVAIVGRRHATEISRFTDGRY